MLLCIENKKIKTNVKRTAIKAMLFATDGHG